MVNDALLSKFNPKFFGTTAVRKTKTMENDFTGSIRIIFDGTRSVVAWSFEQARKYCASLLESESKPDPDIQAQLRR